MLEIPTLRLNCAQIERAAFFKVGKNTTRQNPLSMVPSYMGNKAHQARGRNQMSTPTTVGKRGAEKKYEIDLTGLASAGGVVKDKTLEKVGDDGKTYTVNTKEVVVNDLAQALAAVSNDEPNMWTLFTRSLNQLIQAPARVELNNLALGPSRNAVRMVNSMTACNIPEDVAITTVIGLLAAQNVTVTAEEIKSKL